MIRDRHLPSNASGSSSPVVKAFLLAAGLGTRLRPVTKTIPKCLVPVQGRPLLEYWLELLSAHGVEDVLINLHYLPDAVTRFVEGYRGPVRIVTVLEPELLGSAGTLHANRDFVEGEERFYILYADNLTSVDLTSLAQFNVLHPAPLTVGLMRMDNPSSRGIALLDADGTIVDFQEKPEKPLDDLASAGLFVARQSLFDAITPDRRPYDLGGDVMPKLVGTMNGMEVKGYLRDIGSLESLAAAEMEWPELQRLT